MANEGKFRRLQCEQAVVGVVNDAIAEGEIEIPAGGTKLYKHTIQSISSSPYYISGYVITTGNTKATKLSDFFDGTCGELIDSKKLSVADTTSYTSFANLYNYMFIGISSTNELSAINLYTLLSSTNCSDTVAEL